MFRGLLSNAKIDQIKDLIEMDYLKINSILQQLFRGNSRNKEPLPLFMVQLPRLADPLKLFQATETLEMKVQFEKYQGVIKYLEKIYTGALRPISLNCF